MASRSLGQLTIDLIAKVGGFTAGLTRAERAADKSARKMKSTFDGIRSSVAKAFAFVGAGLLVREIIRNTSEAEKAFALLDNAVKASGGAAGYTTQQLADLSSELQNVSTFDDEAIKGAEQLLLRFQSIQGVNFDRALKSSLDLATAMGTDLASAALVVGKAMENPIKGVSQLARSGVVLSEEQKKLIVNLAKTGHQAEAQAMLLTELEKRYKGAALAARQTFGGALTGLKNAFGDLLEGSGGSLNGAVDSINELTDTLNSEEIKQGFATLVASVITLVGWLAKGTSAVTSFTKYLAESFAAANNGPAAGDLVRLSDGIIEVQDEIKRLKDLGGIGTALRGGSDAVSAEIASYEKQLESLTDKYNAAREAAVKALQPQTDLGKPGEGASINPAMAPPSEEFTKAADRLKEQIALYGKVGEAAKIAYQIQSGGLDELSKNEQQELLKLAQAYDALGDTIGAVFTQQEKDAMIVADSWKEIRLAVEDAIKESQMGEDDLAAKLADQFQPMLEKNLDSYKESVDKANEYQLEAMRNTQDILANGLYDAMTGKFDNIGKAFEEMLLRMAANAVATDIAGKLFGKDGAGGGWVDKGLGFLGGLFGGGKASGGPVMGGHAYRVNENGPELLSVGGNDYLMMGAQSGSVTTNPAIRSSGGVSQTINVRGDVSQRSARQLQVEAGRNLRVAQARLG